MCMIFLLLLLVVEYNSIMQDDPEFMAQTLRVGTERWHLLYRNVYTRMIRLGTNIVNKRLKEIEMELLVGSDAGRGQ